MLCRKLREFPYEDIEFFLPQLCHLIISINNESMALEEFLLDLCEESVTAALLVRHTSLTSAHELRPLIPPLYRHFGTSKHTCMISRRIPRPRPSEHVAGY